MARYDPNMLSTADTSDALSPTTLVLNYLKSKGYQPTAENIRRTVEANAREPGMLDTMRGTEGPDPVGGLRNAPTENTSPARSGSPRTSAPPGPLPLPPVPGAVPAKPQYGPPGDLAGPGALPQPGQMPRMLDWLRDIGDGGGPSIAGGNPPPATEPVTPQIPPSNPPMQGGEQVKLPLDAALDKAVAPAGPLALPGPPGQLALPAPEGAGVPRIGGPSPQLALPAPTGQSAIAGPAPQLALPAPQAGPPQPNLGPILPDQVSRMPVGPSTPDPSVINEANIRGGMAPPPQVPFRSGTASGPGAGPNLGSRILEGFKSSGGVRGALGGGGLGGKGVGAAAIIGGLMDVYKEWQRQHGGQQPGG